MDKRSVLTGVVCFFLGAGVAFVAAPEKKRFDADVSDLTVFTSQGRAELKKAVSEINALIKEEGLAVAAERTQMLQAVTAQKTDRNAADFFMAGMEKKRNDVQAKIDTVWLDAIERMPLIDRRIYMKFYRKSKFLPEANGFALPFMVVVPYSALKKDGHD